MIYPKNGYIFSIHPTVTINGEKLSELKGISDGSIDFFYTVSDAADNTDTTFKDVAADAWYKDAVNYVFTNKLMVGNSDTTFAPDTVLNRQGVFGDIPGNNFNPQKPANRAEVASVLYRWLTAK